MRVDFFEEYPQPAVLATAALLPAPATIYLAAPHVEAYQEAAAALREIDERHTPAWWATLPRSYWVSPFAAAEELEAFAASLRRSEPLTVLFDLELPLVRPERFLRGLAGFRAGRRRVRDLFAVAAEHGHQVATAEYPALGPWSERALRLLGIAHPTALRHTRIPMVYSSLIPSDALLRRMQAHVIRLAQRAPERVSVGLGVLGEGALGNEPQLSAAELGRELERYRRAGLRSATVFRLGGLDDAALDAL